MGTNYYQQEDMPCSECGNIGKSLRHIGKSSGGWCFSLHVYPDENINDLHDWQERFGDGPIEDEYGDEITPIRMLEIIKERSGGGSWKDKPPGEYDTWQEFFDSNYAQPGPNGLIRSQLRNNVVSHGDGTWDCRTGEFA